MYNEKERAGSLSTEPINPVQVFNLKSVLNRLSDAELIAWIVELKSRAYKRLERTYEECDEVYNEGAPDEVYIFNHKKYNAYKAKINSEAKKLLMYNFYFQFDDIDDLFEIADIAID